MLAVFVWWSMGGLLSGTSSSVDCFMRMARGPYQTTEGRKIRFIIEGIRGARTRRVGAEIIC